MVLFISGSYPYAPDGISDGAEKLLDNMRKLSTDQKYYLLTSDREDILQNLKTKNSLDYSLMSNWRLSIKNILFYLKLLNDNPEITVIHMEYPGTYYGKTFLASFLPLITKIHNVLSRRKLKFCVRLHEYTDARFLRKLAIIPIVLVSDSICASIG